LPPGEGLQVEHGPDGVLHLVGELDLATAGILRTHLAPAAREGPVVVDLTEVRILQSAGVEVLYQAAPTGLHLLVVPGSAVATVIRITGLDQVATVEHLQPEPEPANPPTVPGGADPKETKP
jgi:anti-anti-sigma factor